jgi:hypothetical protein
MMASMACSLNGVLALGHQDNWPAWKNPLVLL